MREEHGSVDHMTRGCKGLQPSKSITAIEVLIQTWRAPGPSAPRIRWDNVLISRLQGTAALQVNNSYRSPDPDLEGARSLGAANPVGQCSAPAAARDSSPP